MANNDHLLANHPPLAPTERFLRRGEVAPAGAVFISLQGERIPLVEIARSCKAAPFDHPATVIPPEVPSGPAVGVCAIVVPSEEEHGPRELAYNAKDYETLHRLHLTDVGIESGSPPPLVVGPPPIVVDDPTGDDVAADAPRFGGVMSLGQARTAK